MNKNPKNLSLADVKKKNTKKFKTKKVVLFEDGTKVDVDLVFKPSMRTQVCSEFFDLFQYAITHGKRFDAEIGIGLSTMLIIKHFTSIQTTSTSYEELIDMMVALKDGNYTETMISAFDEQELNIMFQELQTVINTTVTEISKIYNEDNHTKGKKNLNENTKS